MKLSKEELEEVRRVAAEADATNGSRYNPELAAVLFGDTPPLEE